MNYPLNKYPKRGSHWEKNVFIERLEAELRERYKWFKQYEGGDLAQCLIKEVLGE